MKIILIFLVFIASCFAEDIEITNVYKSSNRYLRAVVKTSKQIEVKCAAMDANKNPISVATQYISPPFSEVLIRIPDGAMNKVKNIECYQ